VLNDYPSTRPGDKIPKRRRGRSAAQFNDVFVIQFTMYASLLRLLKPAKPTVDPEEVARLKCTKCGGEYESWDGTVDRSTALFRPEFGKVFGCVVLYCVACRRGAYYHLTKYGLNRTKSGRTLRPQPIVLDYIPPKHFLKHIVTIDDIRQQFAHADRRFGVEARIFFESLQDGDQTWFFISDADSWANLAGRQGYAIVRNDTVVAAILTLLS